MPYVTFVPQAPMGESADPGIFVQGTHVPAPLVERSGVSLIPQMNAEIIRLEKAGREIVGMVLAE